MQPYTDPPINARLRKESHDGKLFIMIEVSAFSESPHICQKEFPGVLTAPTLYVRTDNNESAPIRSAADFRTVVERAVRNRGDALLAAFRSILTSGSKPPEPSIRQKFIEQRQEAVDRFNEVNPLKDQEPLQGYMEASFLPDDFDSSRFTPQILREAAERAHVVYTGWPYLYIDANAKQPYMIQDGLETLVHIKDFADEDVLDFWRFQQSGFFYHRSGLRPTALTKPEGKVPVADLKMIAIYAGEAIDCLTRLCDGLFDDTEYMSLIIRVLNTQDRMLINSRNLMPLWNTYTCRISEIVVDRRLPLAEWRAAIVEHTVDIAKEIYFRFNWLQPNLGSTRNSIERLFARQL